MNVERRIHDEQWNAQKLENRKMNQALFTGWHGRVWRKGVAARVLFKLVQPQPLKSR